MAGFLSFACLLVILVLLGIQRRGKRSTRKQRTSKYISKVKGPLDYSAELAPAIKRFQRLLIEMGRETTKVGKRTGSTTALISVFSFSPRLQRWTASRQAAKLNRHCQRIEEAGQLLIEARDALVEVSEGCIKFARDASQGNSLPLIAVQQAVIEMDGSADHVIQTQMTLRESARAAYGQVSMDVHTSLNWLIATTDQNIDTMEGLKTKIALTLVPALEKKLSS